MAIRYIKQKDINHVLWDRCIDNALNGAVYCYSWYLDAVADHWDALVEDDYRTVMPLVYRKRYLFRELISSPLTKQLGVFSVKPLSETKINQFLESIPLSYKKITICFNRQNAQTIKIPHSTIFRVFELDLITPFEKKIRFYPAQIKESLAIAHIKKLQVIKGLSFREFEKFLQLCDPTIDEFTLLKPLQQIYNHLLATGKAEILGVYAENNELCAAACFVRSNQNVILLQAGINAQGANDRAQYLLIDSFLNYYSARSVTLSLEYFDEYWNPSLYLEFGSIECTFTSIVENRLPFLLRRLFR